MIDFHSHLVPGVDDGASDLEQSRAALEAMRSQGVTALVTTPHLYGSQTARPERMEAYFRVLEPAWARLRELAAAEFPELRVERGLEVMLDTPSPDLGDARVRLAGTPYVLVEFPFMAVPPNSTSALDSLQKEGWVPVIAHPERYGGLDSQLRTVRQWLDAGAYLQVNTGSLLGRYGRASEALAWRLLADGVASYLCSDFHARGACTLEAARHALRERGGEEQAELLLEVNAGRLLEDRPPLPVPPLPAAPEPFWRRVLGALRR